MAEGQPGRYQRSASGMVGAMILCLLLVVAFVTMILTNMLAAWQTRYVGRRS